MKELILENKSRGYQVYRWQDGSYTINVLCGGLVEFEVEIRLNPDEAQQFAEWKQSFADDLAYDISRNFEKYQHGSLKDEY